MTKQEEKALNELDYLNVLMYSVVKQTNVDRMDAVVWARASQNSSGDRLESEASC